MRLNNVDCYKEGKILKGSYTLLIEISEKKNLEVGRLGTIEFPQGFYAYNGSAFGPGGLKRVDRHLDKSQERGSSHWHIDYVLISKKSEIVEVFKEEDSDHECSLSQSMTAEFESVNGFGCSDCGCNSHLFYAEGESLREFLKKYYN